tara:strand:+ start:4282 stop:4800 length:519 start_codon:yes stop_codon:yes gene_type:complete
MIKYIKIYDFFGFKICWLLCAFCTQWEQPYLGPIATLIFILIHLFIVKFKARDIKIIILAIMCGIIFDSSFSFFNIITYQGGILTNYNLAPLWILSMWGGFSLTMLYTLESIKEKYFISALLGGLGGPLSYSAGVGIGSLSIQSNLSYLLLAVCWGSIIPILFLCINKLESQ